jgi:hypothetical protein
MSDSIALEQRLRKLEATLEALASRELALRSLRLPEIATPATPPAGYGTIFVSSTGVPSGVDDAGTVYQMAPFVSGTFTPTYYGSTTAGVTTYTFQRGTYRTDGSVFWFSARMIWTGATGTGNAVVGGLPISSRVATESTFSVMPLNHTFTGSGMVGYMYASANAIQFISPISGGTANVAIDTAGEILISGFYFI